MKIDAVLIDFDAVLIDLKDSVGHLEPNGPDHGTHVEEARVGEREGNAQARTGQFQGERVSSRGERVSRFD